MARVRSRHPCHRPTRWYQPRLPSTLRKVPLATPRLTLTRRLRCRASTQTKSACARPDTTRPSMRSCLASEPIQTIAFYDWCSVNWCLQNGSLFSQGPRKNKKRAGVQMLNCEDNLFYTQLLTSYFCRFYFKTIEFCNFRLSLKSGACNC